MPTRQSPINHIWYFSWYFSLPGETAVLCSKSQQSLKPHSHRHSKRVWKHDLLELDPLRFVPCYMTAYEAGFSHFIKLKFHRGEKKKKKEISIVVTWPNKLDSFPQLYQPNPAEVTELDDVGWWLSLPKLCFI